MKVLIETYWNVNSKKNKRIKKQVEVLIETYWNVNLFSVLSFERSRCRLNRNILECKFYTLTYKHYNKIVLIETYWNVNPARWETHICVNGVLIETYWNVNFVYALSHYFHHLVLIETYWNVNAYLFEVCFCDSQVLIETYWNVNFLDCKYCPATHLVLIETYWNVNSTTLLKTLRKQMSLNRNILECKFNHI